MVNAVRRKSHADTLNPGLLSTISGKLSLNYNQRAVFYNWTNTFLIYGRKKIISIKKGLSRFKDIILTQGKMFSSNDGDTLE